MANPFLNKTDLVDRDVETALLLEKANVLDIGKAVAFTDGDRVFINTDDNLSELLPAYDQRMLKWLLWHEEMHNQLRHHNRYFKYVSELSEKETIDEFNLTKEEVNIIMDILVHDSMTKMFPELVEVAKTNLAQMRNHNSLSYTFKTYTLEEMLKEYADKKEKPSTVDGSGGTPVDEPTDEPIPIDEPVPIDEPIDGPSAPGKSHGTTPKESKDEPVKIKDEQPPEPEHDKTDWDKLKDISTKEFITEEEADEYEHIIEDLKRKKAKLAKLTETLNGLVTTTRQRSYKMPSTIYVGSGVLLKGSTPGRTKLHLCFDASGSMGRQLRTFKDIISKSIPQAMETPTTWFSGCGEIIPNDPTGRSSDYYKGKFKDMIPVIADNGYSDDGDRTIELCWKAEQEGYCPIGVTDGGGQISWSKNMIKQLKNTILVGQDREWLEDVQKINPKIQILYI